MVVIQDLHIHPPVQRKIRDILDFLFKQPALKNTRLIGVEGAEGSIPTLAEAARPDPELKRKVADFLIEEGELTGAEAFAIEKGRGDLLWGVENYKYYEADRQLYLKTLAARKELRARLTYLDARLSEIARKLKQPAVIDQISRSEKALEKGAIEPVTVLRQWLAEGADLPLRMRPYPRLQALAKKIQSGKALRTAESSMDLVEELLLFAPEFKAFLSKDKQSQNAFLAQKSVRFLVRYLSQQVTDYEVVAWTRHMQEMIARVETLGLLSSQEIEELTRRISSQIDFYSLALARNQPMVKNLLGEMKRRSLTGAIMVAGGFHTRGLTDLLRKSGVSYLVVTPTLEEDLKPEYSALYEERLADRHLSIEEIKKGVSKTLGMPTPAAISVYMGVKAHIRTARVRLGFETAERLQNDRPIMARNEGNPPPPVPYSAAQVEEAYLRIAREFDGARVLDDANSEKKHHQRLVGAVSALLPDANLPEADIVENVHAYLNQKSDTAPFARIDYHLYSLKDDPEGILRRRIARQVYPVRQVEKVYLQVARTHNGKQVDDYRSQGHPERDIAYRMYRKFVDEVRTLLPDAALTDAAIYAGIDAYLSRTSNTAPFARIDYHLYSLKPDVDDILRRRIAATHGPTMARNEGGTVGRIPPERAPIPIDEFLQSISALYSPNARSFSGEADYYQSQRVVPVQALEAAGLSSEEQIVWDRLVGVFDSVFERSEIRNEGDTFRSSFRLFDAPENSTVTIVRFGNRTVFYVNRKFLSNLARMKKEGRRLSLPPELQHLRSADLIDSILYATAFHEVGHHWGPKTRASRGEGFEPRYFSEANESRLQAFRGGRTYGALNTLAYRTYLLYAGISTSNLDQAALTSSLMEKPQGERAPAMAANEGLLGAHLRAFDEIPADVYAGIEREVEPVVAAKKRGGAH